MQRSCWQKDSAERVAKSSPRELPLCETVQESSGLRLLLLVQHIRLNHSSPMKTKGRERAKKSLLWEQASDQKTVHCLCLGIIRNGRLAVTSSETDS